jgi:hypothetical protein
MNFYPYSPHLCPILKKFSAKKFAHSVVFEVARLLKIGAG